MSVGYIASYLGGTDVRDYTPRIIEHKQVLINPYTSDITKTLIFVESEKNFIKLLKLNDPVALSVKA